MFIKEEKVGNTKNERPVWTDCGFTSHIADKCYKLYGYPLGYKLKGKLSRNQVSSNGSFGNCPPTNVCFGNFGNFVSQPALNLANSTEMMQYSPQFHGSQHPQTQSQFTVPQPQYGAPQCPISQIRCEQLLSFLTSQNYKDISRHQVASVMSSPTTQANFVNNFSSNPFWSPPSLTHSIFSAHIVDRHAHNTSEWIIDTSATNHMVHSVSLLTTITSTINTFVSLPNGEQALVTHIGTIQLSETLNLHGVLYVPSFTFNLISVTQLTKTIFCCLVFLVSYCFIQDLVHWNTIGLGKESRGLYLLQQHTLSTKPHSILATSFDSQFCNNSNLWHFSLGHPSHAKLSLLNNVVPDVHINKTQCCDVCHFYKQKRLSFASSLHVSKFPFQLIHCDLWGPFSTPTTEGFRFFLTIVDDFSKCTWVYLLKIQS